MNRGLTTTDAQRGVQPTTLTRDEWDAMWRGSLEAEQEARARHHAAHRMLAREATA